MPWYLLTASRFARAGMSLPWHTTVIRLWVAPLLLLAHPESDLHGINFLSHYYIADLKCDLGGIYFPLLSLAHLKGDLGEIKFPSIIPCTVERRFVPQKFRSTITCTLERRFAPNKFSLSLLLAHSKACLGGFIFQTIGFAEKRLFRVTNVLATGVAKTTVTVTGVAALGAAGLRNFRRNGESA